MTDYTNLRKIVTGDIIVKCRFGTEIRRIPINQVPTYDELCLMMYRVFKKEITTPENIAIKYMDNEGDMISLLDDIDITHAISISSLLNVTVYDKSVEKVVGNAIQTASSAQLQASLIKIRDNLNNLIETLQKIDIKDSNTVKKEDNTNKAIRQLTAAELAGFLNDTETGSKASVKELETLSPKATNIPYYPPPSSQTPLQQNQLPQQQQQQKPLQQQTQHVPQHVQQQQPQQQSITHQQHQPIQQQPQQQPITHQQHQPIQQQPSQHVQSPPVSSSVSQQQQQRPVSMQQFPSQSSQNKAQPSPYAPSTPQQYNNPTSYQPPNVNNDPRFQRQGYYVPPPPSSISTPQMPSQPYNVPPPPSTRW